MKLSRLMLQNFMPHRAFEIDWSTAPLQLVCGINESGKTALAEAIEFALRGDCPRIETKGARKSLITDDGKKGAVILAIGDAQLTRDIATAKATADGDIAAVAGPPNTWDFMLRSSFFASLPPTERKRYLFDALQLSQSTADIAEQLRVRQRPEGCIAMITPQLSKGFEAAAVYATDQAAQARGAWKELTGEAYGSVKAESWKPASMPQEIPGDTDIAAELAEQLGTLRANRSQLVADGGAAGQREREMATLEDETIAAREEIKELAPNAADNTDLSVMADDLQQMLDSCIEAETAAQAKVDGWRADVAKYATGGEAHIVACPACGGALTLDDGVLSAYVAPVQKGNEKKLKANAEAQLAESLAALNAARTERTEVQQKRERLAVLSVKINTYLELQQRETTGDTVEEIRAKIARIDAEGQTINTRFQEIKTRLDAIPAAEQKVEQALARHYDIVNWTAVAADLSPDGIPGEIMAKSLDPLNKRLAQSSQRLGWPVVSLNQDMAIQYGRRPYAMASESGQWRANVMLQEAIVHLICAPGARSLIVDRVDMLHPDSRGPFLKWMHTLATAGEVDSVLMMATLKEPPKLPPTYQSTWLGELPATKE